MEMMEDEAVMSNNKKILPADLRLFERVGIDIPEVPSVLRIVSY